VRKSDYERFDHVLWWAYHAGPDPEKKHAFTSKDQEIMHTSLLLKSV